MSKLFGGYLLLALTLLSQNCNKGKATDTPQGQAVQEAVVEDARISGIKECSERQTEWTRNNRGASTTGAPKCGVTKKK